MKLLYYLDYSHSVIGFIAAIKILAIVSGLLEAKVALHIIKLHVDLKWPVVTDTVSVYLWKVSHKCVCVYVCTFVCTCV